MVLGTGGRHASSRAARSRRSRGSSSSSCAPCDVDGKPPGAGAVVVAADAVGAGIGEVVLYAAGSSARQTQVTQNRPVDARSWRSSTRSRSAASSRYVKARSRWGRRARRSTRTRSWTSRRAQQFDGDRREPVLERLGGGAGRASPRRADRARRSAARGAGARAAELPRGAERHLRRRRRGGEGGAARVRSRTRRCRSRRAHKMVARDARRRRSRTSRSCRATRSRRPGSAATRTSSSRTSWSRSRRRRGRRSSQPVAYTGDDGLMLTERAPLRRHLLAVTPTTNPTETILCNAIGMVAGGNAVVFNVHPSARADLRLVRAPAQRGDPGGGRPARPVNVRRAADDRERAER